MHKQDNFILFSNLMIFLSYLFSHVILSSIPFSKRGRGRGRVKCTGRTISVFAPLGSFIDYIVYIESQMVHKYWEKPSLPTRISRYRNNIRFFERKGNSRIINYV